MPPGVSDSGAGLRGERQTPLRVNVSCSTNGEGPSGQDKAKVVLVWWFGDAGSEWMAKATTQQFKRCRTTCRPKHALCTLPTDAEEQNEEERERRRKDADRKGG